MSDKTCSRSKVSDKLADLKALIEGLAMQIAALRADVMALRQGMIPQQQTPNLSPPVWVGKTKGEFPCDSF